MIDCIVIPLWPLAIASILLSLIGLYLVVADMTSSPTHSGVGYLCGIFLLSGVGIVGTVYTIEIYFVLIIDAIANTLPRIQVVP